MLVLEYKAKGNKTQYQAIEEAIKTTQFVRNKCLRYWMDSSKEDSINNAVISRYSTVLRADFPFVAALIPILCEVAPNKFCRDVTCNVSTAGNKAHLHKEMVLTQWQYKLLLKEHGL